MTMNPCTIREASHVKIKNRIYKIKSKFGVWADGTLAKPSQGGFGVYLWETIDGKDKMRLDGNRADMFEIDLYFNDEAPPVGERPWTAVEREIILADMAFLKQQEIDSGARAIWEADQAKWATFDRQRMDLLLPPERPDTIIGADGTVHYRRPISPDYHPGQIVRITVNVRPETISNEPDVVAVRLSDGRYVALPKQRPVTGNVTPNVWRACLGCEPGDDDLERANCHLEGQVGHYTCGWCSDCLKPKWQCGHEVMGSGRATRQAEWPPQPQG
jgi:hypothetical protein